MKTRKIIYLLLIIAFGAFIAYRIVENSKNTDAGNDKAGKKGPVNVSGLIIKPTNFDNVISLSGSIEADEQVEIHSEVSGIVESINFQEGSTVAKGQLLFKVNDSELKAQLSQTNTKETLAGENERRAKLLLQKEAISQEEYDISRAEYVSSKAQSQLIKAQIAKTYIRAPFSGKIGLRSISAGTYITPSTKVTNLVNIEKLKITFSIPEKYALQIKDATEFTFTVAGSKEKHTAKVYAIEPAISVATRTLQVRAIADNKKGNLLAGTFADVALPLAILEDAIVIPTEAIIPIENGKKVFISNLGKAKEILVETATRTDNSVLVLSGLKAGDTLITSGIMALKDKAAVKVKVK
ncbi:efflux RND transporter periplasmic adaptor subunit [Flavobacterium algicola]|uniref:efflux RND transporter periplasmic adaptor subunit n=1 Tax=Flavobacterium algicola TaxID=556529 RepID=UPI001EFE2FDB|nr:efflux RND transporter periplasmic adaptor subunit [Flavobacterium algicola]MCG9792730.1 efflux RND transporter periplasmic adaptor subunit [Flavobacterium algicola]